MKYIVLFLSFSLSLSLCAQENLIQGSVIDSDGFPVSDAEVCIADSTYCVFTDLDGNFTIKAKIGDLLSVNSFVADVTQIQVEKNDLIVQLESNTLEELVVVNAGIGATEVYKEDEADEALYGARAGVEMRVEAVSEEIRIRGASSIRSKRKKSSEVSGYSDSAYLLSEEKVSSDKDIKAGQLTAGEVNDFSKWYYWEDIQEEALQTFRSKWKLDASYRYCMILTQTNGNPVNQHTVQLVDKKGQLIWEAKTDNSGKAELWANPFSVQNHNTLYLTYRDEKGKRNKIKAIPIQEGVNFGKVEKCSTIKQIDIVFMVDATGSMSDEMRYLQSELLDVIRTTKDTLTRTNLQMASVFYRDHGDVYVTKKDDFQPSIIQSLKFFKEQRADGGGDYPEAYIEALEQSIDSLHWREESTLKILFTVLDAPPHFSKTNIKKLQQLLYKASQMGIKIIPIASSGIDKETEFLLRTSALLTNGTYTFLTDHSGIGNPHIEPTIDTYEVELLNALLKRLIMQYTYTNECGADELDSPTSMFLETQIAEEAENAQEKPIEIQVYPIPTSTDLNIVLQNQAEAIQLIDFMGRILLQEEKTKKAKWNIQKFPKGVYYVRVWINEKPWVRKVIFR